jgi:integrase/recombinase XerD
MDKSVSKARSRRSPDDAAAEAMVEAAAREVRRRSGPRAAGAGGGAPGPPAGRAAGNRGRRFPPEVLTPEEVRSLIRACSARAPTGIRNRALLAVLARGGLRVSEALALRPKDVDPAAGSLTVLRGKGGRSRVAGLDPGAMALVERWLQVRRALGVGPRRPLFCTLKGGPLQSAYLRELLPRLARKAGVEKRVHPHGLRHTHAAELVAEGVPVNVIQAQLGHASLRTTDVYLRHIAPAQLLDTMRRREWSL